MASGFEESRTEALIGELIGRLEQDRQFDVDAFLARHGDDSGALRARIDKLVRVGLIRVPLTFLSERYRVIEELGRGGQGVVYLARDSELDRQVALKVLVSGRLADPSARLRFEREARTAGRLQHSGIAQVFDLGQAGDELYIVMEYVKGETLAERIRQRRRNSSREEGRGARARHETESSLRLIEQVGRALHAAHEAGLIHRDIKPGNIMVTADDRPVVLDFGLARDLRAETTQVTESGLVVGSPAYMAPEQITGESAVDRRADVWALGVVAYELLTLDRPFNAPTHEGLVHAIRQSEPPRPDRKNPALSREVRAILETAIQKDASRRYQTCHDLAEDIRRLRRNEPLSVRPAGPVRRLWKWSRRHPARAVGIAAAIVILAVLSIYLNDYLARRTRRDSDLTRARQVLDEARDSHELFDHMITRGLSEKRKVLADLREMCREKYASTETRASLCQHEIEVASIESKLDFRTADLLDRFELARRLAFPHDAPLIKAEINAEMAKLYVSQFHRLQSRQAEQAQVSKKLAHLRDWVSRFAPGYPLEQSIACKLILDVSPAEAEIHLFRYESYADIRAQVPVVSRQVPVPTSGRARCRPGAWISSEGTPGGFAPGDICLTVTAVARNSLAAKARLKRGDLVLRLNGEPCGDGLFVSEIRQGSPAAAAGIRVGDRILELDGSHIENSFDSNRVFRLRSGSRIALRTTHGTIECSSRGDFPSTFGLVAESAANWIQRESTVAYSLTVLRNGELSQLDVSKNQSAGLVCEGSAYPLILSSENRVRARTIDVDPGSYLIFARNSEFEDLRMPVLVTAESSISVQIKLLPTDTTPSGFVYVPPGHFLLGESKRAYKPLPRQSSNLDGFFIARKEVTIGEWLAFLNDAATRDAIDVGSYPESWLLPRHQQGVLVQRGPDGQFAYRYSGPDTPVLGVTRADVQVYLNWRNRRATADKERWVYDLPTDEQWEKAAIGADQRLFPWGNRFDHGMCVGLCWRPAARLFPPHQAHGEIELRDESPFGVRDMGGSRTEWTRDSAPDRPGTIPTRGGSWQNSDERTFMSASRVTAVREFVHPTMGFRLVARRRE